ncbi:sensor histidine kinase [Nostoc sp. FACHB-152]|uniref:sensor histidine kinase n=1 Tax=Nostoc sp. FACHB-152 TaxID=2692837 RepID=UPI00168872E4|nr:ATP-binding protein [Nostoc sp. FACHB-152]MBD2450511.1 sensor histidine kinase [Nostoc sp. FACHB-152]
MQTESLARDPNLSALLHDIHNVFKGTSIILDQLIDGLYGGSLDEIRPLLIAILERNNRGANLIEAKSTAFYEINSSMVTQFDMLVFLKKMSIEFCPIAQSQSLKLHYEASSSYKHGTQVRGDMVNISRMISNLLQNAIKYTNRGEVFLRLLAQGDDLLIEIEDTGIGIAAEQISTIFLPFWRARENEVRNQSGMGLGLYIALMVAHAHGLKMKVNSIVGQGTKFSIVFPYNNGVYGLGDGKICPKIPEARRCAI